MAVLEESNPFREFRPDGASDPAHLRSARRTFQVGPLAPGSQRGHSCTSSSSSNATIVAMSGHVSPDTMSYNVLRAIPSSAATAVFERPANAAARRREISAAQNTAVGDEASLRPSGHFPDLR